MPYQRCARSFPDRAVLELAREQRATPLELAQHVTPERRFSARKLANPALGQYWVDRRHRACSAADDRQRLYRPEERVPLEEHALLPEKPVELGGVVRAEPAPEDEVLGRRDGRNRVELEEAEVPDRLEDAARDPSRSCARTAIRRASSAPTVVPRAATGTGARTREDSGKQYYL